MDVEQVMLEIRKLGLNDRKKILEGIFAQMNVDVEYVPFMVNHFEHDLDILLGIATEVVKRLPYNPR